MKKMVQAAWFLAHLTVFGLAIAYPDNGPIGSLAATYAWLVVILGMVAIAMFLMLVAAQYSDEEKISASATKSIEELRAERPKHKIFGWLRFLVVTALIGLSGMPVAAIAYALVSLTMRLANAVFLSDTMNESGS